MLQWCDVLKPDDIITDYSDSRLNEVISDIKAEAEATEAYQQALALHAQFIKHAGQPLKYLSIAELLELEKWGYERPGPDRYPNGSVTACLIFGRLLFCCRSVAECAAEFKRRKLPLHGLCSNAGVIDPPDDSTPEGFEVGWIYPLLIVCLVLQHVIMELCHTQSQARITVTEP